MKRTSVILLVICGVIAIYLGAFIYSVNNSSRPTLNEAEATDMLHRLADAFDAGSVDGVTSFAAPDAKVAGQQLDQIRKLLARAFANMKKPHLQFTNIKYEKQGESTVLLHCETTVTDEGGDAIESRLISGQPIGFVVERRSAPRLFGMLTSHEWKITRVDLQIPSFGMEGF